VFRRSGGVWRGDLPDFLQDFGLGLCSLSVLAVLARAVRTAGLVFNADFAAIATEAERCAFCPQGRFFLASLLFVRFAAGPLGLLVRTSVFLFDDFLPDLLRQLRVVGPQTGFHALRPPSIFGVLQAIGALFFSAIRAAGLSFDGFVWAGFAKAEFLAPLRVLFGENLFAFALLLFS